MNIEEDSNLRISDFTQELRRKAAQWYGKKSDYNLKYDAVIDFITWLEEKNHKEICLRCGITRKDQRTNPEPCSVYGEIFERHLWK